MRLTKRQRDEAFLICACSADPQEDWGPKGVAMQLGIDDAESIDAVWDAYSAVLDVTDEHQPYSASMAEAAALLEDGWSPGDPVRRLR